ncbi:hypothetical protein PIB30_100050, partial [Stylosanthes scabra]|nr:hypothetical protein [Stylosanthes scabra]
IRTSPAKPRTSVGLLWASLKVAHICRGLTRLGPLICRPSRVGLNGPGWPVHPPLVVRDCTLPPIDKKNEKEEIIVDYVQSVPSSTSNIQLPPKSQLEL